MAVTQDRFAAGGTIQTYMTTLHTRLLAQGWIIEYADADAIGTGSAATPAWTKAPVVSTSAGIVVYRMPASGALNRWFIKVQMRWVTAITNYELRLTTAQGVNAGTGVLTAAGTEQGFVHSTIGNNNESFVVVNEHGFLLHITGTNCFAMAGVERIRDFSGVVQDDAAGYNFSGANTTSVGFGSNGANFITALRRNWTVGERAATAVANIFLQGNGSGASAVTLNEPSNNVGYPTGPYSASGGLAGMFRLIANMASGDAVNGSAQALRVDGTNRQYLCTTPNTLAAGYRMLYALE